MGQEGRVKAGASRTGQSSGGRVWDTEIRKFSLSGIPPETPQVLLPCCVTVLSGWRGKEHLPLR